MLARRSAFLVKPLRGGLYFVLYLIVGHCYAVDARVTRILMNDCECLYVAVSPQSIQKRQCIVASRENKVSATQMWFAAISYTHLLSWLCGHNDGRCLRDSNGSPCLRDSNGDLQDS